MAYKDDRHLSTALTLKKALTELDTPVHTRNPPLPPDRGSLDKAHVGDTDAFRLAHARGAPQVHVLAAGHASLRRERVMDLAKNSDLYHATYNWVLWWEKRTSQPP